MTKPKVRKKTKDIAANSYFALKSQNEIYYQMASIFKEATNDEDKLAKEVLTGLLTIGPAKVFMPEVSLGNF